MKIKQLLAGATLVASSCFASAITIDVSDIAITDRSSYWLTWSTSEYSDFSFELNGTSTQAYGTFYTRDFPINFFDDIDRDRINASMHLDPPGSDASTRGRVTADGYFNRRIDDRIVVNFNNDWINMGAYEVSFQDLVIFQDGRYDLLADFREVVRVSEPGTLALFGLGLIGLGFSRRRLKS